MSNTYKLDYKRSVLRGVSDLISTTSMLAMKLQAYHRMTESDWLEVAEPISSLPVHWWNHSGFSDSYDAATFCGDYSEGKQKSYACASCYTIKIPRDAQTGIPAKIEAVLATVRGDRWLSDGAVVSAFISNSETPPSWHTIIDTDNPSYLLSSPDPAPAIDDVTTPNWQAPLRGVNRSNAADESAYAATITADTPVDAGRYLHVIIRMSDYLSVYKITLEGGVIKDNAWVEGGANIDGTTLQVQFDRAVNVVGTEVIELFRKAPIKNDASWDESPTYDINAWCLWNFRGPLFEMPPIKLYRYMVENMRYYPSEVWSDVSSANTSFLVGKINSEIPTIGLSGMTDVCGLEALLFSRTGVSSGGVLKSIHFANSIPFIESGIPEGMIFRLALYLAYPDFIDVGEVGSPSFIPKQVAKKSATNSKFWAGQAETMIIQDTGKPEHTLSLTPLKAIDLTESIPANEVIPIDGDIVVKPGLVMLVACLSVYDFVDGYNDDPTISKLTEWNPADSFYLTLEENF